MDPDPGGPKTCGSGGSGSGTLVTVYEKAVVKIFMLLDPFLVSVDPVPYQLFFLMTLRMNLTIGSKWRPTNRYRTVIVPYSHDFWAVGR